MKHSKVALKKKGKRNVLPLASHRNELLFASMPV